MSMATNSKLIIFAHRGEAQAFFNRFEFKQLPLAFDGLYYSTDQNLYLLVTGEGHYLALEKTISVLTKYAQEISEVINFGICANLSDFEFKSVLKIRTIYLDGQFQSFTLLNGDVDCITSESRILNNEQASKISNIAPLADRELWGIARACQLLSKPLRAIKVVSDKPKENIEICKIIKELAGEFSEILFHQYTEDNRDVTILSEGHQLDLDNNFYITTSQQRQISNIYNKLKLKYSEAEIQNSLNLSEIKETSVGNKQRTQILIQKMRRLLSPKLFEVIDQLEKIKSEWLKKGIDIKYSSNYDSDQIRLSCLIETKEDLQKFGSEIQDIPVRNIQNLLNGQDQNV